MKKEFENIIELLKAKATVKQDVFINTKEAFCFLKETAKSYIGELAELYHKTDSRVEIKVEDINAYEFRIFIGGDILVFHMHTNVFQYPKSHYYWQTSYFKDDPTLSYGGMIHIYNFLADSIQLNRENDLGFLIARLFINRENHFALEGQKKLNRMFKNLKDQVFDEPNQRKLIECLIEFSMEFELYIPPYKQVQTVSVKQAQDFQRKIKIKTSKRLGFKLGSEHDR
jgi:hypothetical protein